MRLYLIRHAEPAYPADALTPEGHRQARALARRLAAEGLDRICSSPMVRALDTARPSAHALGLAIEVEPWTRELEDWWVEGGPEGEWPAWQVDPATLRTLAADPDPVGWTTRPPFDRPALARGFAELQRSSDTFLERHGYRREGGLYRSPRPGRQRLAVFCHGGFALTWLAHLLAIPPPLVWAGFTLPPCSVTTVAFEELPGGAATPRCLGVADLCHLAGRPGEDRIQPQEVP